VLIIVGRGPPVLEIFFATFSREKPLKHCVSGLREGASAKRGFLFAESARFPPVRWAHFMRNVSLAMGLAIRIPRRG
jgi:hypothetical protein